MSLKSQRAKCQDTCGLAVERHKIGLGLSNNCKKPSNLYAWRMIAEFDEHLVVKAKPADVFAYLADGRHHPLWSSGLQEVRPAGTLKEGQSYMAVNYQFGQKLETKNLVTKLKPDQQLEIYNETGPIIYRIAYTVMPTATGTKLQVHVKVESGSAMFQFAKPVFEYMARSRIKADMDTLKGLAESRFLKKNPA